MRDLTDLVITTADENDAGALYRLRCRTAGDLTRRFGAGPWTSTGTEHGMRRAVLTSRVLVVRQGRDPIAALNLQTRRPWAIDASSFTPVGRVLYLVDMRVDPSWQRLGIGRWLLSAAEAAARDWPADAIRLDAYDAPAGAGRFYDKCGYRECGRATYRAVPLVYYERLVAGVPAPVPRRPGGRIRSASGVRATSR
jgi:GNAT superfamily N-acetyltransferase